MAAKKRRAARVTTPSHRSARHHADQSASVESHQRVKSSGAQRSKRRDVVRAILGGALAIAAAVVGYRVSRGLVLPGGNRVSTPTREHTGPAPVLGAEVLKRIPHDTDAFTQGLVIHNGRLFESTGLFRKSSLREIDRETGAVLRKKMLVAGDFGEGLTALDVGPNGWLVQVLWQNRRGYVYDAETLVRKSSFKLDGNAWGLAVTGPGSRDMYMTNGTSVVQVLRMGDDGQVQRVRSFTVYDGEREVGLLNELQVINGELWANVWPCDYIARIDVSTGQVKSWLDLSKALLDSETPAGHQNDVLNGIAHDAKTGTIYVTGKLWPRIFVIRPTEVKTANRIENVTDALFLEPKRVKYMLTYVLK